MKIKQYIPDFCSGFTPKEATFNTKEEFLNIDWIQDWVVNMNTPDTGVFTGFMVAGVHYLVATYNYGYQPNMKGNWKHVAVAQDPETIDCLHKWFPKWYDPNNQVGYPPNNTQGGQK